ncbi:MAG TPA: SNF2-related protein [Gemmatimonadaceae bacterium]|nr:SNF2-related protein [Gemmatimonadaceae bacterium]
MPRVALLLADDVGLGKTIEAGLVLTELLRRRRVRRVLILCPASLRTQWRDEMRQRFALSFDIVDRQVIVVVLVLGLEDQLPITAPGWCHFAP